MSTIKRKSSIALIVGIIIILLLIPLWYAMLVPSIIASEIEKTDLTTSYEGTIYYSGYGVAYENVFPILIEAHVYVDEVEGNNVNLKVEANTMNMTDPNNPNRFDEFSYNSTYVIDKFTLENVLDSPDADKNRTGYDPLYPQHLKKGEDITNVWLDNLNTTGTLEFKESVIEEDLTLYKYFVNKTIAKESWTPFGMRNITATSTKTLLIEPLSGVLAYTENETLVVWMGYKQNPRHLKLVDLTYKNTEEAKTEGIELAKTSFDGIQLLELYLPTILGVVAIILVIGLSFNIRRLKRKMA